MKSSMNRHFRNRKNLVRPNRSFETLETRFALANTPPTVPVITDLAVDEDVVSTGFLTGSDLDGDPFLFSIVSQPSFGKVELTNVATGAFKYTPNPNFYGIADSFTYIVTDIHGVASNDGIVQLEVKPVNDAPVAVTNKTFWVAVNSAGVSGPLPVTDVDGDLLTYQVTQNPTKGVVTVGLTGQFIYAPDAGQTVGQDFFEFTATDPSGAVSNTGRIRLQYVIASGNVTAVVDQDDPSILMIDGTAGNIIISQDATGGYDLSIRGNGTFVNGSLQPQSFAGIKTLFINFPNTGAQTDAPSRIWLQSKVRLDYLEINTGGGADTITLGANPNIAANNDVQNADYGANGYIHLKTVVINTGDGSDSIFERYTRISTSRAYNLGKGQDTYDVYGSVSTPESHTFVDMRTLEDSVKLGYGSFFGSVDIEMGESDDLVSVYACYFGGTAFFDGGQGSDTMAFDVNHWAANSTIDGGAQDNFILFARSVASAAIITITSNHGFDSGDDEYIIGRYITGSNANGFTYANGGSHISSLNLNTGFGNDKVTLSANIIDNFYAELLEGDDEMFLDGGIYTVTPTLSGGNGTNRLRNPNGYFVNATNFQLS